MLAGNSSFTSVIVKGLSAAVEGSVFCWSFFVVIFTISRKDSTKRNLLSMATVEGYKVCFSLDETSSLFKHHTVPEHNIKTDT